MKVAVGEWVRSERWAPGLGSEMARTHGDALRRRTRTAAVLGLAALSLLLAAASASAFTVQGSVEQVDVTGLAPNAQMSLLSRSGATLLTQEADAQGGLLFRNVKPGKNYRVRLAATGEMSGAITVHTGASVPWDPSIYDQEIPDNGYTYLTTRDGTQLAIDVHPPTSPAGEPGVPSMFHFPTLPIPGVPSLNYTPPYPTLIEYSGYGYADPAGPENGIAVLANLMGFAVVDVNMRGTGCSGGAFDFFEKLQNLDGYDVIETIAHQPWVLGTRWGCSGSPTARSASCSRPRLSPRDLEAIAPLSVIDATGDDALPRRDPQHRLRGCLGRATPAERGAGRPGHGQAWATKRIEEGDQTCKANQVLHGEAAEPDGQDQDNSTYNPAVADPLDPVTFVNKINVPTFMACQWEDEQTGGHCADLVEHFTGTSLKWFTFTNGAHVDSLDPYTFDRLYDFLELYVAHQAPITDAGVDTSRRAGHLPASDGRAQHGPRHAAPRPDSGKADLPNGAGRVRSAPGDQGPVRQRGRGLAARHDHARRSLSRHSNSRSPSSRSPARRPASWYFGPDGTLTEQHPRRKGRRLLHLQRERHAADGLLRQHGHGRSVGQRVPVAMELGAEPQQGTAVSYVSAPLTANTTVIGGGAVHLWVKSSAPDVDFQATVSEVRPDGNERFVQDGWLRATERKLSSGSKNMFKQRPTALQPDTDVPRRR